jgi:hypothetical protein
MCEAKLLQQDNNFSSIDKTICDIHLILKIKRCIHYHLLDKKPSEFSYVFTESAEPVTNFV